MQLRQLALDPSRPAALRLDCLKALQAGEDPNRALPLLRGVLQIGELAERQQAFATLGKLPDPKDAGPDLSGVGSHLSRLEILRSLVSPISQLAKETSFEVTQTVEGEVHHGRRISEDDQEVHLQDAEGKPFSVPLDQIADRKRGLSSMPDNMSEILNRFELRDVVEFLAQRKSLPADSMEERHDP